MVDNRRVFSVTAPAMDGDILKSMLESVSSVHDGKHFELFYNILFQDIGFTLPDHLRPVAWAVGDNNIKRLMIIVTGGSGKSQLSAVAYPVWELGLNNDLTIMGVSAGEDLMMGWLQESMNIIENSKVYHTIFPTAQPDKNRGWSQNVGAFLKRQSVGQAEASYSVAGTSSRKITGKHAQLIIMDDLHNDINSGNADQITKVEQFFYQTMMSRQDPRGCRMIMIGRRWAADDLYGRLTRSGDWCVMTLPALRETAELYWDVRIPAGLSCVFNDFQPSTVVEDIKVSYGKNKNQLGFFWKDMLGKYDEALVAKRNLPTVFEASYQGNPESDVSKIFRKEEFRDFAIPDDMYMGRNYSTVADFIHDMNFDTIIQSWDTAMTDDNRNDPSVCYCIAIKSCTKNHRTIEPDAPDVPYHYDIYVLDEIYKRLQFGDLQEEAVDYYNSWRPEHVLIPKSDAGIPLINHLQSFSIQLVPITVQHSSKRSKATNGARAGSAQGWAKQGNILIPQRTISGSEVSWAKDLLNELSDFTGAKGRRDDRVDALIQAVNYAIDLGITTTDLPEGWREKAGIDAKMLRWQKPMNILDTVASMCENVSNPFWGMCGSCRHFNNNFCKLHERPVIKLGSCPMYNPQDNAKAVINILNGNSEE